MNAAAILSSWVSEFIFPQQICFLVWFGLLIHERRELATRQSEQICFGFLEMKKVKTHDAKRHQIVKERRISGLRPG
jgi:hypothetical protein